MGKSPLLLHPGQEDAQITQPKAYERQKNEPALWFQRFTRYMLMARERSVQAVLEQERQAEGVLAGVKSELPPDLSLAPGPQKKRAQLASVAIPGNWQRAMKQWRWKERAEAWDLDQRAAWQQHITTLLDNDTECANSAYRIYVMNCFVNLLENLVTRTEPPLPMKERFQAIRLSQSLMKDIAKEMKQR